MCIRDSPYTSAFALAETCVLVKQSPEPLLCAPLKWGPLIPKLRGQLAEFLNEGSLVHLRVFALAYQCRFAVRAPSSNLWGFLDSIGPVESFRVSPPLPLQLGWGDAPCPVGTLNLPDCVPQRPNEGGGTGILTGCPSPTPFGLGLGPTNPTPINVA